MTTINAIFGLVLVVFAVLQVNDPDVVFWAALYATAGVLCLAAAWRPRALRRAPWSWILAATVALIAGSLARLWPEADAWWRMSVWWEDETAREELGLLIALFALAVAWWTTRRRRR